MQKKITTLFIDLDGTVYDKNNSIMEKMTERIASYMQQFLHIAPEDAQKRIDHYYQTYGSTLRGIQEEFSIDTVEYLDYIHEIDLDHYLKPDETLHDILAGIDIPKWIFTNATRAHAERVLSKLAIADQFEGILDVWTMDYVPKPHPWVYQHALEMVGDPDPWECIFVDDSARNLKPAHHIGISTIWVGADEIPLHADLSIPHLYDLPIAVEMITEDLILPEFSTPFASLQMVS